MQPAKRLSCSSGNPLFLVQVSLDRVPNLTQSLCHPQTGRMKRPTLIVVENAPNHGAILQDHVPGRFFPGKRVVVGGDRLNNNEDLGSACDCSLIR